MASHIGRHILQHASSSPQSICSYIKIVAPDSFTLAIPEGSGTFSYLQQKLADCAQIHDMNTSNTYFWHEHNNTMFLSRIMFHLFVAKRVKQ